ncbi:MAG TPA: AAA family ATPase [Mariprofundaceae bacterium]|nr:AAA family ATPase [Mariprofundaceae bacterium]
MHSSASRDTHASAQLPATIRAMLQPSFYDHPAPDIRLIQTHISWVVLTGSYAYKVKKPVDFGFLDFSSLEKRHRMCLKELALNRRLAPDLYLDVLPVCRSARGFRLGGGNDADAVEYCLKMAQFDPDALFSHEIDRPQFDPAWMDVLARQIAGFHAAAEVVRAPAFGSAQTLGRYIAENLEAARGLVTQAGPPDPSPALERHASRMLRELSPRIRQRQRDGLIRACHGDMHLGNIALVHGEPRIFDCIEFNDELRLIDTMNDVAFLVMDCDARARPGLGMRLLSRYLEHTGDYGGLMLLRLYQFYRAGVRGKVAFLLSRDSGMAEQAVGAQIRQARHYFSLAASYGEPPGGPGLYAVGGLSGSGKSHLALIGSGIEHALVIRSDATRKRLAAGSTASLYTPAMSEATYRAMIEGADAALAAGYSVILDATFLARAYRDQARQLAESHGIPLRMLWLDLPPAVLRQRIRARDTAGTDVSDADLAVLESQLSRYQRPDEPGIRFLTDSDAWPGKD